MGELEGSHSFLISDSSSVVGPRFTNSQREQTLFDSGSELDLIKADSILFYSLIVPSTLQYTPTPADRGIHPYPHPLIPVGKGDLTSPNCVVEDGGIISPRLL